MHTKKPITGRQQAALRKAGYTDSELNQLSVHQASSLLHYVGRNNWKRPTRAQVEAIAAGELVDDQEASKRASPLATIPSTEELEEITKDMNGPKGYAFDEAMDYLREAVSKGKEAILAQGRALCMLKQACNHGEWARLLQALRLPRTTAHRQMQVAKAHAAADYDLRRILKSRGVKFDSKMTARDLKLVRQAAEMAKKTKEETEAARDLFHDGTNAPQDDNPFADLAAEFQREEQVKAAVETKVGAFLDEALQTKALPAVVAPSSNAKHSSRSTEAIAREISELVIGRLQTFVAGTRSKVWDLIVHHVSESLETTRMAA
jgi:hypothetical protein